MKDLAERYQQRWQKIRHSVMIVVIIIPAGVLMVTIILGYWLNWDWTGLGSYQHGKTLWDWLQLLIIPIVLAVGAYVLNLTNSRNEQQSAQLRDQTEREITFDNQREAALQAYVDKMSDLLLEKMLRDSAEEDEVRTIARARTLAVLPRLDTTRKGIVLQFLYESNLVNKPKGIIGLNGANLEGVNLQATDLEEANLERVNLNGGNMRFANLRKTDLSEADLSHANLTGAYLGSANLRKTNLRKTDLSEADLSEANLSGAYLSSANLTGANLTGANLTGANLTGANLTGAYLSGTDLTGANLTGANTTGAKITGEDLNQAKLLKGAIMPDGSIYP